ncbi:MAG TPA: helix-turn-helix domain-containing protein [Microlunatus sp.]|nr:helix-turn-helix domain-containing protein [Microlunatus sp.]
MDEPTTAVGVSLEALVQSLGAAVATVAAAPAGLGVHVGSVALLEQPDLEDRADTAGPAPGELCVVIGATAEEVSNWLRRQRPAVSRLRVVATKISSADLEQVATRSGIALLRIHPQARVDLVLGTVRSLLEGAAQSTAAHREDEPLGGEGDLYGLAQTVASLTGGLVSIEDERAQLLAYSATDGAADELRMLSILGREGPADYLRRLREWGVYDRLRRERGAIEVPAAAELGWRRRLVVGIRPIGPADRGAEASLGTIWLQEGAHALDQDAAAVLEGAAAVAARLIERVRSAPTREAQQIQRLLGLRGGGVDIPSLAAALSLPSDGPAAVVGIGPRETARSWSGAVAIAETAAAVRLHASAYARESLVTATEDRIYVLIPRARTRGLSSWLTGVLDRLTVRTGFDLRAAVAAPVTDLAGLGAARAEVDRVLDRPGSERITTLARSRTSVLLGEIADLLADHDQLQDPRWQALVDDDAARGGSLAVSVEKYLDRFGDVRAAASDLHIHQNTLRYRIRRAEQVLGIRLDNPQDRLLVQLQILRWRRSG